MLSMILAYSATMTTAIESNADRIRKKCSNNCYNNTTQNNPYVARNIQGKRWKN